ncbi:hypothetical protein Tco_1325120, partial [Tanacetum coccineum]
MVWWYSAVPPPHPLIYNRPKKLDMSYSGLDEFKEPEFKGYGHENKEQVSQDTSSIIESSPNVDKETIFLVNKKINCNNHQRKGIVSRNNYNRVDAKTTHTSVHKNMSPRAVLLKTGLTPLNTVRPVNTAHPKSGKPQQDDKGFVNSGCSRHMTGNIAYLLDFKEFDGGYAAFGGGAYGGRITGKGTLKTDNLNFEDLLDENQILLKIPRKNNMYSFDMKNNVPKESLTYLIAKATLDESMLWHRRL